jgi:hypothetical protein
VHAFFAFLQWELGWSNVCDICREIFALESFYLHWPLEFICLSICHFGVCSQINSQKKKTGVIAPKRFVQRVKKQNELFRSYMHQVHA